MNWILYDPYLMLSMGVKLVAFALIALLCGSSSGCIFAEDEPEGFDLIVNSSISQGTIVESYENGDLINILPPEGQRKRTKMIIGEEPITSLFIYGVN